MADHPQQIFLSYSREDVALARDLRERLVAFGHSPWMDLFDIPAGARWPTEIDRALKSSDVIVGLMSPDAVTSENVMNEWDWAIANSRRLILLLIEPCEIPFHYVSRNYIDLTSDQAGGFAALAAAIESREAPATVPTRVATQAVSVLPPSIDPEPGLTIVGRQRELSQLREAMDRSLQSTGQLVLVGGEAGIGKTTIVQALLREAEQRGCLVLSGGCYDLTTTPPYGPWEEITRAYPETADLPLLPAPLREGTGSMEGIPSQAALFDLVASFLAEVADRKPLVLLLEDLHWSDAESLALLRYVSRSLSGHRIIIVATYRDDEITRRHRLAQLLPRLVRESRAERVSLHQLDSAAIRELIQDRYALDEDDEERLKAYLEERSEGNPLYVEELLFTLESEETLTQSSDDGWSLGRLEAVPVPMLIVQLIEDRLSNLEDRTRELLEVLAVIGHEVDIDLWRQVSEADDAELIEATRQALEGRILVEAGDGKRLQFRHALIREALTTELVALERQHWHRKTADALIQRPHPDPDAVVTHLERADDPRLIEWLVRAGERAMDRLAWDVAVERYEHGVRILRVQREREPELLCDLLLALGAAQHIAGSGRGSTPGSFRGRDGPLTYSKAVEAARDAGSPTRFARAVLGLTFAAYSYPLTDRRVVGLLEEALALLPNEDSVERSLVHAHLAAVYRNFRMYSGIRFEPSSEAEIERLSGESIAIADRVKDPYGMGVSRVARASLISRPHRAEELRHLLAELWAIRGSSETERQDTASSFVQRIRTERYMIGQATASNQFLVDMTNGEVSNGQRMIEEFITLRREIQTPTLGLVVNILQSGLALGEGRFADAKALIEEADAIWPNTGIVCNQTFALCLEQDRLPDAEPRLTAIFEQFPQSPLFRLRWILYLLETGDEHEAASLFSDIDISDLDDLARGEVWAQVMALCAEISVALGDRGRARSCYELLQPYPDYVVYCGYNFYCGGSFSHYLGLLAGLRSEWEKAEAHFEQALEQHQAMGFHPLVAHTRYAYADMLQRRGNPGDRYHALELLDQSLQTAQEIGMIRLERLASQLQKRLRVNTR